MKDLYKEIIEDVLYERVKLIIESQYDIEGVINPNKKDSTKIIFKDRKKAITMVKEVILEFTKEHDLDVHEITEILMKKIEEEMQLKPMFKEEFEEVKEIVLIEDDSEER